MSEENVVKDESECIGSERLEPVVMANKLEDVEMQIAIGQFGGGIAVKLISGGWRAKEGLQEYGPYLDDLFYEGSELPKEVGIYIFKGGIDGWPSADPENWRWHGTFTKCEP
jgi:hypothetical protein